MILNITDENNLIKNDMSHLFEKAIYEVLNQEFIKDNTYDSGITVENIKDLPLELSITIVGKNEIKDINREFRNIDKVTDVLSFPQYGDKETLAYDINGLIPENSEDEICPVLLGDVVLCYDKAVEQASEYGNSIEREIIYLYVHSLLHLLGYDHMEDNEKKIMRKHEEDVMAELGINREI